MSELSSQQHFRIVPQIVTTQVPETVPEEQTSRSNTLDLMIPRIPIKQMEEKYEKSIHNQQLLQGRSHDSVDHMQR
jgi:hypothetical protein